MFAGAKKMLAQCLSVTEQEIYLTSGGTESSNIAILGAAEANKRRGKHIICTGVEHPAGFETVKSLRQRALKRQCSAWTRRDISA